MKCTSRLLPAFALALLFPFILSLSARHRSLEGTLVITDVNCGGCAFGRSPRRSNRHYREEPHYGGWATEADSLSAQSEGDQRARRVPHSRAVGHARASRFWRLVSAGAADHTPAACGEWDHRRARYGQRA